MAETESDPVDMAKKINQMILNSPVTKMVEKLVKDTERHIKELEKYISDIETLTIQRGADLLKKSIAVARDIDCFGKDWINKKALWWSRAEKYANVLKRKKVNVASQMKFVEVLVTDVIEGSVEFEKRGRKLHKQALQMSKEATTLGEVMNESGKSLIELKEKEKTQQRLGHIAMISGVLAPPYGFIPPTIASIVIETFTIPKLKNKIKEVKHRLKTCNKIWEETANVSGDLAGALKTWIAEATDLKQKGKLWQQNYADYNKFKDECGDIFQEDLIEAFTTLAITLKNYA